ncbi:MAG: hypothetical protein IMF01_09970 [Proteobacteria bacterium]|nr:hypothetical protein [Pseudomonadota bacterium]
MTPKEYNVLYLEVKKLRALGDVLRCNPSKLQNDTVESIGGLIFIISTHILKKVREWEGNKGDNGSVIGITEKYVI